MDTQTLAITNHPGHAQLQALGKWLEDTRALSMASSESAAEWARLNRVFDLVMQRLTSSDPALIPFQTMDGIFQSTANVIGQVSSFSSNRNLDHLHQANKFANDVLYHALLLPGTEFKKARKSLLTYMDDYAQAVTRHTANLHEKTTEGLQNVANLNAKVNELQSKVETQITEIQTLSTAQALAFSDSQIARTTEFDASEKDREQAFMEAEALRNESLAKGLEGHETAVAGFIDAKTKEADQLREDSKAQAEALLDLLEEFKDKAEELVGLTGTLTRANAYREAAKSENIRAWIWSGVAASSLISLSVVAFRTLWLYTNGTHAAGIDWSGFSIRLYTLFALTGLAFYAGRQGEIHRNAERQNRRLFSDLASVSPFLSDLADEKREAIIEEIARRVFGQPEAHVEPMHQSPLLTPEQIGKAMEVLTEAAGKTIKKL